MPLVCVTHDDEENDESHNDQCSGSPDRAASPRVPVRGLL